MTFIYLRDFPEHIPTVAGWIYQEFVYEFKNMTLEQWIEQVRSSQGLGSTMLIALENNDILGTASLDDEDLPPRPDLGPWLASVYVPMQYRSRGVASKLIEQVEQEARKQGVSKIYLHTHDREGFYLSRGWVVLERLRYLEKDLVVMGKNLGSNL